jgi:hypothetical protein
LQSSDQAARDGIDLVTSARLHHEPGTHEHVHLAFQDVTGNASEDMDRIEVSQAIIHGLEDLGFIRAEQGVKGFQQFHGESPSEDQVRGMERYRITRTREFYEFVKAQE